MRPAASRPFTRWARAALIAVLLFLTACAAPATVIPPVEDLTLSPTETRTVIPTTSPSATLPAPTPTPPPTETPGPTATAIPEAEIPIQPSPAADRYLPHNTILSMAVTDAEHLWTVTGAGVIAWNLVTGLPRLYTTIDGLARSPASRVVYCPSFYAGDHLYVGHDNGMLSVFDLRDETWSQMRASDNIQALTCDRQQDRLLTGGTGGVNIFSFKTREWTRIGPKEGMTATNVTRIRVNGPADWVAAGNQGGYLINGSRAVDFRFLEGYPAGTLYDLATNGGGAWVASPAGLAYFRISDQSLTSYGAAIPFTAVHRIELAEDGSVWISNNTEGACPFNVRTRACTTLYPVPEEQQFTALEAGLNGIAFSGTDGVGVIVMMPDGVRRLLYRQEDAYSTR